MTKAQAISWLLELAGWFERRAADSQEDIEVASYQQNAAMARKIATLIFES